MTAQAVMETPGGVHGAHGGRKTLHGSSYQLKLLMLFIVRGLRNNVRFRVATEMEEAGKFDDVVITQPIGDGEIFKLLQAKHSAGECRATINARNLILGGDFCLPMYFKSYLKIQANPRFCGKNKQIKDLILFTNKGFKYKNCFCDFELREDIFEKERLEYGVDKEEEFLKTVLFRFKKEFKGRSFLVSHLKNALVQIPQSFAESVIQGKFFELEKNNPGGKVSETYGEVMLKEVIDLKIHSFRTPFIEGANLTPEARHFRDVLRSESFAKHHGDESVFKKEMINWKVKVIGKVKRNEIDSPPKVAEKLASLMRKEWDRKIIMVTDCRSVIARNVKVLAENVFVRNMEGEIRFSPEFMSGNNLAGNIPKFRKQLMHEVQKRGIEFTSIRQFQFEIINFEETPTLPNLPSDEIVEAFLEKLAFAVDQPSERELDDLIKGELLTEFNAVEAENVHGRFLVKTFEWMTDLRGRELSHEECSIFFQNLKREMLTSVRFRLKHPSTNFTGREKELIDLQEALHEDNNNPYAAPISQSVVIIGIAGVGKTELAKRYIYLHSGEYDNLIWINAKNKYTIGNSFRKLAFDKLGIRQENVNGNSKSLEIIVGDVYDFLRGKSSLFVFDGARKLGNRRKCDSGLRQFLPKFPCESRHYSLITSRFRNWGDMKQIPLDIFSEKEAMVLIGKTVSLESPTQVSQAEDLAKALHFYPLALQQALSYLKVKNEENTILGQNYSIPDYLEALEESSRDLLDFPLEINTCDSYTEGTYRTWEIAISDIKAKKRGKLALKILVLISYFAPDDISLENIAILFPFEDNSSLIQALIFLKRYSMISIEHDKVSIHKLVQMITRLRLKEEKKEEGILRILLSVGENLDAENSIYIWNYSIKYDSLIEKFSYLPGRIIQKLTDNFKLGEAYQFSERTLNLLEEKLGKRHICALIVKEKMAIVTSYQGRYEEALRKFEEIHKDRLLTQEDDNAEVLRIKHHIANTLNSIGRYEEALECYEDVLSVFCTRYGEYYIDTLSVENNIANVLYHVGDYQKALSSYEKVYKAMSVTIGEDHEKALNTKLNLANALGKLGQLEKALVYYQEVYEVSKDSLNENLLINLDAKFNMASVLGKLGKYSDSLDAYEEVLKKLTDIYDEDHPGILDTMYHICYVLYKLREYDRALKSYQEVGEAFSRFYGQYHEKTLHCNFFAAHVLYNLGFYRKALHQYQDIYEKLVESKGYDHPKILPTSQCIANTLQKLGELDKALQIHKENYEKIRQQFGVNDLKTILSKQNLAKLLFDQGKYQEAYEMNSEIYQILSKKYGESNEDTLTAKHNIGRALDRLGKLHESVVYLGDVHKKRKEVLGEEHPLTKCTEEDLKNVRFKIQNLKSWKLSGLKYINASDTVVNDVESVEEDTENFNDFQSEHNCRTFGYRCVCFIYCFRRIKTLLI